MLDTVDAIGDTSSQVHSLSHNEPYISTFQLYLRWKGFHLSYCFFVFQVFSFSSVKQDLLANACGEASGSHYVFSVANSVNIKCSYNLVVYFKFSFTLGAFTTHCVISWKLRSPKQSTKITNCKMKKLILLVCLCGPVINSIFGRRCRKTASRGREDTRVWYQETMFSQMIL